MKITQDVRDYAQRKRIGDIAVAIETGMQEKADEFAAKGGDLYPEI
jgi:phosphomethylpyrimidine synthase